MIQRIEPGPGQRSVWDFPRPPIVEAEPRRVRIEFAGVVVADSGRAARVLETSHPPGIYVPPEDIAPDVLRPGSGASACEWKGRAVYWSIAVSDRIATNAAWSYPDPMSGFEEIAGYLSFYPARVDACWIGDERVVPQEGDFYGGWITSDVVGPFKGGPGTFGW